MTRAPQAFYWTSPSSQHRKGTVPLRAKGSAAAPAGPVGVPAVRKPDKAAPSEPIAPVCTRAGAGRSQPPHQEPGSKLRGLSMQARPNTREVPPPWSPIRGAGLTDATYFRAGPAPWMIWFQRLL